jgi:hypothetical protein
MTTGETGLPSTQGTDPQAGEDTVELELTAAEQLDLSRAAAAALSPSQVAPSDPGYDTLICARTRRADILGTVTFALFVCAIVAAAGWHTFSRQPDSHVPTLASSPPPTAPVMQQPQPAVVQVVNPFDATEVFELPPETGEAEARDVIAQLLLQRARERRQHGVALNPASNRHPHRFAAAGPSEIFVTKVSGPANRFSDPPGPRPGTGAAE